MWGTYVSRSCGEYMSYPNPNRNPNCNPNRNPNPNPNRYRNPNPNRYRNPNPIYIKKKESNF